MSTVHLKRMVVMAGVVSAALVGALLMPVAAQAQVSNPPHGSQPGAMKLSPTSGTANDTPNWSTTTACPSDHNVASFVVAWPNNGIAQQVSDVFLNPASGPVPSHPLAANMGSILSVLDTPPGTWEFTVECNDATAQVVPVQSTFVTFDAAGNWTASDTPPAGAVTTTTSVSPSTTAVGDGGMVTFNATVGPNTAVGQVEFLDGTTSKGLVNVTSGAASLAFALNGLGQHTITAKFEPTNANNFSASQGTTTVTVTGGNTQAETINVNVPSSEGPFILTVSTTPVSLGTAVLSSDFTHFSASGTLSDVTVSDERNQSHPGWRVNGQIGNFSDGTHTIPGNDLGWVPAVKTQNPAADAVAGAPVAAGSTPGLTASSPLASAPVGLHTTVLNAALDFEVPANTAPGNYSATLTITAVPSFS